MNTIIFAYGIVMIILGISGWMLSGSPTSLIGTLMGVLVILGAKLSGTQSWAKFLVLVPALLIVLSLGARLPGYFSLGTNGEISMNVVFIQLFMWVISVAALIYYFTVFKASDAPKA
ncbi:hypothetical protein Ctha_0002 [Chloroherpeton thalassium ATCC 35110]|uniref:Transmembrane protein n=1 Tax=Chloroherpeton thalassium (strain ATCC 35110 / GB-78) TaxID=517418 RepID=B3QRY9_CHLT3|nr:TMEM14 family protein [Chloroherpeton thalassium]ACF12474.1 hypothetical protein Ctha_0002 [Chloroherpeton thalassium ATCC 35110]